MRVFLPGIFSLAALINCSASYAQDAPPWGAYFQEEVRLLNQATQQDLDSVTKSNWDAKQSLWRAQLREMLGISPSIERTDLKTTTVGSITLGNVTIDRLHYQSRPGLYVAANLYRPVGDAPDTGWPAVLYVCGHARVTNNGRLLGNKTNYQHHGLWLARHGVVCLMIDTVQLGEFHGEHHGTYKLGRWDWISRGYTPAGVEAWNAIRGIDLLAGLPEVDSRRIGITGRSGGGAYSWFAAALDDRIRVAVPVAGITDLENHVVDGCVEGHCDCMYFVNYHGWDYAKLAALVAPRPLLLANSDRDGIFPLDGVMRIHDELAKLYAKLDASDNYGVLITPGPHKDTQELQVGAFKWLLKHLTAAEPVVDSAALKEVQSEQLTVFETEIPRDQRVTSVGRWFVPAAPTVTSPKKAALSWKEQWLPELQRIGSIPAGTARVVSFREAASDSSDTDPTWTLFQGNAGEDSSVRILRVGGRLPKPMIHVGVADNVLWTQESAKTVVSDRLAKGLLGAFPEHTHYFVQWRGAHWAQQASRVKARNQLVRRFYLLGQTPEQIALADLLAAITWIASQPGAEGGVELAGIGRAATLSALAGLVCAGEEGRPQVATLHLGNTATDPQLATVLPGILRVCDFASVRAAAEGTLPVQPLELDVEGPRLLVDSSTEPQQASGLRIVEVGEEQATIWVRATRWPLPNLGDLPKVEFEKPATRGKRNRGAVLPELGVDGLRFAVPGAAAEVRVSHRAAGKSWQDSPWIPVGADTDFSALVPLEGLTAATRYSVRTQVRAVGQTEASSTASGSFRTLPAADSEANFRLAVGTCQAFVDRDGPHGFDLYRAMLERDTDAFVMAGDVVYYDSLARSVPLAYYHWQRTYSLPTLVHFHRQIPTFFLKDDHDTYVNDTWPGTRFDWTGDFTFEDGQRVFIQQTGLPSPAYRTFYVGKDLQVWLMEGRDYRSPNNAPDGPEKSIWGKAQKQWLRETLSESTAKFRVIISPTPIVGPDRENKRDNHANKVFEAEGREVRQLLSAYPNTVSVCGDRHWQFHSVDPETGLHEFSVGPVSDRHAGGWNQKDYRPEIHQFLRVAGGYLEIELSGKGDSRGLTLRHLDTRGRQRHSHTLR